MCGRFALTLPDQAATFLDASADRLPEQAPRYNICPTQAIMAAVLHDGRRQMTMMRWGFLPRWYKSPSDGPLLINARSETLAEKPAFRDACRTRRCLVPATGFYEWTKDGKARLPWFLHPAAAEIMAFAGVWQSWTGTDGQRLVTCAIVTTAAPPDIAHIHDRMPVLVARENFGLWLGEAGKGAAQLMASPEVSGLAFHRVDPAVNKARYESPELIEPLD